MLHRMHRASRITDLELPFSIYMYTHIRYRYLLELAGGPGSDPLLASNTTAIPVAGDQMWKAWGNAGGGGCPITTTDGLD